MKYLILIHSNPTFLEVWEGMSEAERVEFGRGHRALADDLTESGELIVSEALADTSLARRVTVREGRTMTTDGPFAEVKEHLAGFYLVECDSIERAVEWAARAPDAAYGEVEVRPVLDLSDWDEWEL
ncbi:MAG: YciI family protein [Nocardioidaceae bacterium]